MMEYTIGQRIYGFTVTKSVELPELQCVLVECIHDDTGAQVMHIGNNDSENVFALSFRTESDTATGVAHILEHTVLCGSEKYPVKDPFFSMSRRSLNTFLNAMTLPDFTCYPAASQVPKDFTNLLSVYLDAVFHPKLELLSFLQEGHRLEHDDDTLIRKGVVYNEMKGAMSSPNARLFDTIMASLLPNTIYAHNFGGDPTIIPDLSYEDLIMFHKTFYHPSRCIFYFYGNMPLEGHLRYIEDNALKDVKPCEPMPPLARQKRFSAPVTVIKPYPITPEMDNAEAIVSISWLTTDILNQLDILSLSLLDNILMGTDAAPLKMALLHSGLCKQAASSVDTDMCDVPFLFVMKGCEEDSADAIEKVIRKTLTQVIEKEIPKKLVDAAIHQLELGRSEITGDSYPFGLTLFFRAAPLKHHGGNAEDGLMIHTLFSQLRHAVEDENYLPGLIRKYILENPHYSRITMVPDDTLAKKESDEERKGLDTIDSSLSDADNDTINMQAQQLFDLQEEECNPDVLPKISIDDIPLHAVDFPLSRETVGTMEVFSYRCFTNNFLYATIVSDLPPIADEDLPYIKLFATLLPHVGNAARDYKNNLEYIQENTGGISASLSINIAADDMNTSQPLLYFGGKALHRKADKLFPLLKEMVTTADFSDKARIQELLLQLHTSLENAITSNAMKYAIASSCSGLSEEGYISDNWNGLRYLKTIRDIIAGGDNALTAVIDRCTIFRNTILCLEGTHLVIGCEEATYDMLTKEHFYGLTDTTLKKMTPWQGEYTLPTITQQAYLISSPVAFTSKAMKTVSYSHPSAPHLSLASYLLDNKTLHKKIREQGGAYGAGAVSNATSGDWHFFSYRDPHIAATIDAFTTAVNDVIAGTFSDIDLEEAMFELIQRLDSPMAPGSRVMAAYSCYRHKKTRALRQQFRDTALATTRNDIIDALSSIILPQLTDAPFTTYAGKTLVENDTIQNIEIHTV